MRFPGSFWGAAGLTGAALAQLSSSPPVVAPNGGGGGLERATIGSVATAAPPPLPIHKEVGTASWYGTWHQERTTASGERFDLRRMTAAHPTLPLHTKVKVTNLRNGRSVEVRINDRGPYARGRAIDLSAQAAQRLGMKRQGLALVEIEVLPGG